MRVLAALAASSLLLGACATPIEPGPNGPPTGGNGNDCAVIAAIAREHYRFNTTDNRPPPIWFEGDYAPRCDWSRFGLAFERYDPYAPGDPRERDHWVSFGRPVYDGRGAVVQTSTMGGPWSGVGHECRVISGFAGWTVPEGSCRETWVS